MLTNQHDSTDDATLPEDETLPHKSKFREGNLKKFKIDELCDRSSNIGRNDSLDSYTEIEKIKNQSWICSLTLKFLFFLLVIAWFSWPYMEDFNKSDGSSTNNSCATLLS